MSTDPTKDARLAIAKNPPRVDLAQFSTDDMKAIMRLNCSSGNAGFYSTDGLTVAQRINNAELQGGQGKGADTQRGVSSSTFDMGPGGYQITPQVAAYLVEYHAWQKRLQDAKDAELAAHEAAGTLTKEEQKRIQKQAKKAARKASRS